MVNKKEKHLNQIFSCLSDPTRRNILSRVGSAGMRVSDLSAPLKMSAPAVSKHLRVLEESGLITREIKGREHIIHLNAVPLRNALDWIAAYRHFWDNRLEALEKELGEIKW